MSGNTRVMHITYDMRIGGTEMVIKNLIEGFASTSVEMSIFCIESPLGPWGEMLKQGGIQITTHPRQPGFDKALIKAIRAHIREYKIDIIHCHQYTPWVYGVIAAAGLKTKVIFTEHGRFYPDFGTWKRKLVNPVLQSLTDSMTAISAATRQALVTHENLSAKKISVIYNGIQALLPAEQASLDALREQLKIQPDTLVLGTIARFDPIKNHLMMLSAFKDCLDAGLDAVLVIVGDGEMRSAIEQRITELGIVDAVRLTGYQPQPSQYLSLMDIFLLSSFSEGTSMTLLEAMSIGKPCVVTDAGGNKEVIGHNENGLVVDNDNQTAFALAIQQIARDKALYDKFANTAKCRFAKRFSVTSMCDAFNGIYQRLAS